jgi:N-acetylglucosamine-6-phosphate deacetylase
MTLVALTGARIFDGAAIRDGDAVIIDGPRIAAVVAERDVPAGARRRPVDGLIAPGFIDVQVNGGGGVLFNATPTVEAIAAIGAAHRRFGTTGYLTTLITDTRAVMGEAVAATREALARRVPGVLGVHLEGPFLNPERKGVHDPRLMRPIEPADVALVTSLRAGRTLMTVAPEKVPLAVLGELAAAGIVLAAGHTAASYETVMAAHAAGLAGITHLFNAMPPLAGREPGPVAAALDAAAGLFVGLIVDLIHVSAASLRIAIAAKGWQRMMLVTDAMPSVGTDLATFAIGGSLITRRNGKLTRGDGTIAGSDLDMASAVRNTVAHLGLPLAAALHMAAGAPAAFLGLDHELGRIAPGFRADLVLLDERLQAVETWIDGVSSMEMA